MTELRLVSRLMMSAILGLTTVVAAEAQESVTIALPGAVSFEVGTGSPVTGSPDPTTVTFSEAQLDLGQVLRISVKADAAWFDGPEGSSYAASDVSWTVSGASGGSGSAGTLDSAGYTQIFQSDVSSAGEFDVTWTFTRSSEPVAGTHSLTLRWKLESVPQ